MRVDNNGANHLYAVWQRKSFDVSYAYTGDVPAGANEQLPATSKHDAGSTVTVEAIPTVPGYTFNGWDTMDATVADGSFTMPSQDVNFVGSWTQNNYTVTYMKGDHGSLAGQDASGSVVHSGLHYNDDTCLLYTSDAADE